MIPSQQVTVVFQGGLDPSKLGTGQDDGSDFIYNVARTRAALPQATIILSTWEGLDFPEAWNTPPQLGIDHWVLSPDPGGLPNIKFGYDAPNNVNRQIVSTQAGLAQATTPYVLKLRTDSFLVSDRLLQFYQHYVTQISHTAHSAASPYSPIAVPTFFTIDPTMYEHMAFHISDWAQFGHTQTLIHYWDGALMTPDNATYFERHRHSLVASYADHNFRTRLAVEQHITTQYAQQLGYAVPTQFNEITPPILHAHRDFLAKHIIILDILDYGLRLPKYGWTLDDAFMLINCISHDDWYKNFYEHWHPSDRDEQRLDKAKQRADSKRQLAENFANALPTTQSQTRHQLYP